MSALAGPPASLLTAPLELHGDWGKSLPQAAECVIARMREACFGGLKLLSDQQPARLRVDDHTSGSPAVWLHEDFPDTGWIIVDIGERAWCQLAYQFGHELGHVFCNSWHPDAKPQNPCQWLEEALVETFSVRGLGRLAQGWEAAPPFPGDAAYSNAIRDYRKNIITEYEQLAARQGMGSGLASWFAANRTQAESMAGLSDFAKAAVPSLLQVLEADDRCVEDMGALNRWPSRSAAPLRDYLRHWRDSCAELGGSGHLPQWLERSLV
jgi:hypothetical protein